MHRWKRGYKNVIGKGIELNKGGTDTPLMMETRSAQSHAVLCRAVLCCAALRCAALCCAVLCCAMLCCVSSISGQKGAPLSICVQPCCIGPL